MKCQPSKTCCFGKSKHLSLLLESDHRVFLSIGASLLTLHWFGCPTSHMIFCFQLPIGLPSLKHLPNVFHLWSHFGKFRQGFLLFGRACLQEKTVETVLIYDHLPFPCLLALSLPWFSTGRSNKSKSKSNRLLWSPVEATANYPLHRSSRTWKFALKMSVHFTKWAHIDLQ